MREIKFRAWDKEDERMVYTDWGSFRNWYNESIGGKVVVNRGRDGEKLRMSEPMQFTGLHDKNGKEIWEGDVVRTTSPSDALTFRVGIIEYREGYFSVGGWYPWTRNAEACEVLGNIYENPELLKGEL